MRFQYPKPARKPDDEIIKVSPPFPHLDIQENGLWSLIDKVRVVDRSIVEVKTNRYREWDVLPYQDSDLASIPGIGRLLFKTHGTYTIGAIIHDDLYRRKLFPRKYCDDFFRRVIIAYHTPPWKANMMFIALRMNLLADLRWRTQQ